MVNIDEYLVKIQVNIEKEKKVINGSGVIFPLEGMDYDYVITALHCLKGVDFKFEYKKIIITRKNSSGIDEDPIEIIDSSNCYESDENQIEKDFVIIKIRKFDGLSRLYIESPKEHCAIEVSCYPSTKDGDILSKKNGKVKNYKNSNLFFIEIDPGVLNVIKDANLRIGGASGAGIFQVSKNNKSLIGILTDIGNNNNTHNELLVLDIKVVEEYLKINHLNGLGGNVNDDYFVDFVSKTISELSNDLPKIFPEITGISIECDDLKKIIFDGEKTMLRNFQKILITQDKNMNKDILKRFLVFLLVLKMENINFEIKDFFIKIENTNNLVFKTKNPSDDMTIRLIISELKEYLYKYKNKLSQKGKIYLSDIIGKDIEEINCYNCYSNTDKSSSIINKIFSIIPTNLMNVSKLKEDMNSTKLNNLIDLSEITSNKYKFRCGDCFKIANFEKCLNKAKRGEYNE